MAKKFRANTLGEFITQQQNAFPYATGDLSRLLTHIGIASKIVNREVNMAGLVDILGETGTENIQGESVKELDDFANTQFKSILGSSIEVCGMVTEEEKDMISFESDLSRDGKYIVCMDPLDGSSNIDVNISIGTVFSIYRRISKAGGPSLDEDFLQPGTRQVAAGYVLYGSSTMLVYTTGMGVTGFTLDPSIGEFFLSHAKIVTPDKGPFYSINEGKLRLTYECNPIAFLAEQSGGTATDGRGQRIMEIRPEDIHQRVPLFTGSPKMMKQAEDLMRLYG